MSLRSAILTHAVPILGRTSFTRAALTGALASLPPTHPDYKGPAPLDESVVDTLFGAGPTAGPRALVDAFAQAGLDTMNKGPTTLQEVLSRRLEHSAALGEHIVEAYALMATPSSPSLPLPPLVLELLRARLPSVPIYAPGPGPVTAAAWRAGSSAASSVLERTGGRLPLPTLDAAASLRYAWDIADAAVYAARPNKGVGVMREPRGAGVEWYTTRVGLTIAYLQAESHLLHPYPQPIDGMVPAEDTSGVNPHLPAAQASLARSLKRLDDAQGAASGLEHAAGAAIDFIELATRSVAGIVRSRGF